jgi:hypothetical protein
MIVPVGPKPDILPILNSRFTHAKIMLISFRASLVTQDGMVQRHMLDDDAILTWYVFFSSMLVIVWVGVSVETCLGDTYYHEISHTLSLWPASNSLAAYLILFFY